MAHDIFISYSSKNAAAADAVCARLEAAGMRCWYAPRDIEAGDSWAAAINRAIGKSKILVLIYTDESIASVQVLREINLAADAEIPIVPLRLTGTDPSGDLRYYLSGVHWMDAMDEELDRSIGKLVKYCEALMETVNAEAAKKAEERRKARKKKAVLIAALCCCLAVLAAGAALWFAHRAEENRVVEGYLVPQENRPVVFASLPEAETGDFVGFGSYEQDNHPENGPEPITWKVLAREPDSLLLLSWYGLALRPYSEEEAGAWDTSGIRAWLNGEFLDTAFSDKEKKKLVTREYEPDRNPVYGTDPGQATEDTVTLLTVSETMNLLDKDSRDAIVTETLRESRPGKSTRNEKDWWLRTPGGSSRRAAVYSINFNGTLKQWGYSLGEEKAVRPVIRVSVPHREEQAAEAEPAAEPEPGYKIITLGRYEQDGNPLNGPEPIEWIVLDEKFLETVLVSRYVLDAHEFHTSVKTPEESGTGSALALLFGNRANNDTGKSSWSGSSVRQWLNTEFLYEAFTEEERNAIQESILVPDVNTAYDTLSAETSNDRLYLPGSYDLKTYFNEEILKAEWTPYAECGSDRTGLPWWLRTPGAEEGTVMTVNADGKPDEFGEEISSGYNFTVRGIRPMLRLWPSELKESGEPEQEAQLTSPDPEHVVFGRYEQDDNRENGPEPLLWRVLDVQGNRALLITEYGIDTRTFEVRSADYETTWEISPVRAWLNGPFLQGTFNEAERGLIRLEPVRQTAEATNFFDPGNDTEDRVFLPSGAEILEYFPEEAQRIPEMTDYAWHQHFHFNNSLDFVLLRDGYITTSGEIVNRFIADAATGVYKEFVRPMVWVESDYFLGFGEKSGGGQ